MKLPVALTLTLFGIAGISLPAQATIDVTIFNPASARQNLLQAKQALKDHHRKAALDFAERAQTVLLNEAVLQGEKPTATGMPKTAEMQAVDKIRQNILEHQDSLVLSAIVTSRSSL